MDNAALVSNACILVAAYYHLEAIDQQESCFFGQAKEKACLALGYASLAGDCMRIASIDHLLQDIGLTPTEITSLRELGKVSAVEALGTMPASFWFRYN